jgi:hypothetical protein
MRRYTRTQKLDNGKFFACSPSAMLAVRNAVITNSIQYDVYILQESDRLDVLAGKYFNDGRLWWIIAAASGIGWGLQVPPGTRLNIPRNLSSITALVG